MDLGEEGALVSLLGPPDRLLVAHRVVELVSKGVRTLLERWDWDPSFGSVPVARAGTLGWL